jgi:predicted nuclease of restriction endonuclease-like (RecB) superfamily
VQENSTVQIESAQLNNSENIQTSADLQFLPGQFPNFLALITLTNHYEIINGCKTTEERIFMSYYSYKERLNKRELQRCLKTNVFASLMGDKRNVSRDMKEIYPQSVAMLKDTLFLDFLDLPQCHSEKQLQHGILDHMKEFVLELGKDFCLWAVVIATWNVRPRHTGLDPVSPPVRAKIVSLRTKQIFYVARTTFFVCVEKKIYGYIQSPLIMGQRSQHMNRRSAEPIDRKKTQY